MFGRGVGKAMKRWRGGREQRDARKPQYPPAAGGYQSTESQNHITISIYASWTYYFVSLWISIPGGAPRAFLMYPYMTNWELTSPAVMTARLVQRCTERHQRATHSYEDQGRRRGH